MRTPEPSSEPIRIVQVLLHGHVQGVGFRAWVHHQAELRGLDGWVRNRRDGTVEAVFAGPSETVEAMLAACRQGPASARVERLEMNETDSATEPSVRTGAFEVLGTV